LRQRKDRRPPGRYAGRMNITPDTPIATLVREFPAAIAVLQKYDMAFCCTGATPLATACAHHHVDPAIVLADIERARTRDTPRTREHFQQALASELPRISTMLTKLVGRHGERLPHELPPLQVTFEQLRTGLVTGTLTPADTTAAVRHMRVLTGGFVPPDDACPTFRGVYFALAQLEGDLQTHVQLEAQ
jgi:regulator of cell morphogenesis and NO signaling